jgi:hypothetical protein
MVLFWNTFEIFLNYIIIRVEFKFFSKGIPIFWLSILLIKIILIKTSVNFTSLLYIILIMQWMPIFLSKKFYRSIICVIIILLWSLFGNNLIILITHFIFFIVSLHSCMELFWDSFKIFINYIVIRIEFKIFDKGVEVFCFFISFNSIFFISALINFTSLL